LTDLADASDNTTELQRGIAALKAYVGPDHELLLQPRPSLAPASFTYTLPVDHLGVARRLEVEFPSAFPRAELRVKIEPSAWLQWPHVFKDGMCLFGGRQRPFTGSPEDVVTQTLSRVHQLLGLVLPASDPELRQREFESEIASYWIRQATKASQQLVLLARPSEAQTMFALTDSLGLISSGVSTVWLASKPELIEAQQERMSGQRHRARDLAASAFYVPLTSLPSIQLPRASALHDWLSGHVDASALGPLEAWLRASARFPVRWLVLDLPGADGARRCCVFVLRATGLRSEQRITYGLRANRAARPHSVGSSQETIGWATVHVLDRASVHGRDRSADKDAIARSRVLLVGTGTLGGAVAVNLARAGIGRLTLVDPETLADVNLGRHVLGVESLGRYKAAALRARLRRDLPGVDVVAYATSIEHLLDNEQALLNDHDLVLVTTADWGSESLLWQLKGFDAGWSMLQAWSEPHGHVGHALAAPAGPFDARPLFTAAGRFRHRFSEWPDQGIVTELACGDSFVPSGPVALARIATMISQLTLEMLIAPPTVPVWRASIGDVPGIASLKGRYHGPLLPDGATSLELNRNWPAADEE
jgi:hypothetical protein